MAPRRFRHWAYLNEEGKRIYGDVFPDGTVPVVVMIQSEVKVGLSTSSVEAYLVYHEEMAPDQVELLLSKIADKFKVSKEDVRVQMISDRIPLRRSLTDGSGTDGMAQFL